MKNLKNPFNADCMDVSTIGERGQIVIPKNIREKMKMKTGDKFLFLFHDQTVMLAPISSFKVLAEHFQKSLKEIDKLIKKESK